MKTETKTGRWKYAAIVLIVTLLVGLFWSYVKKMGRRAKSISMEKNTASRAFSTRNFPSGASITKKECGICLWNSRIRMHNF